MLKFDLNLRQDRISGGPVNIVVDGIKESGEEKVSESEQKVRKLFSEKLQLDHLKIGLDWAHRTGKTISSSETCCSG